MRRKKLRNRTRLLSLFGDEGFILPGQDSEITIRTLSASPTVGIAVTSLPFLEWVCGASGFRMDLPDPCLRLNQRGGSFPFLCGDLQS